LVLAIPKNTSGDTSSIEEDDSERDCVWWVLLVIVKLNLGYEKPCRTPKWFHL
jgi:hypothetical protein